jgi:8-amino-7-oxononanoate synthase
VIRLRKNNRLVIKQQSLINFTQNDYLALATHPLVKHAFKRGVDQYGLGSGASPSLAGFYAAQHELEEKMAAFLQRDRALLFNSGFNANLSVMTAIANRHTHVFADKFCHASILEGIQLSRAKLFRFRHNDVAHAKSLLQNHPEKSVLVTESVFSMDGDISPVDQLSAMLKPFEATLIVDDAHGIGVLGKNGRGICDYYQLSQKEVPCLVVPFGKAFASMGAVVAGEKKVIESLLQFAKAYRYTTALPPAIAVATLTVLELLQKETWRREKLQALIDFFNQEATARQLPLLSTAPTPIKSIVIGDNERALHIQKVLQEKGFLTACIRPPTVPVNSARIRLSLNCLHEERDIIALLDLITETLS